MHSDLIVPQSLIKLWEECTNREKFGQIFPEAKKESPPSDISHWEAILKN